MSLADKDCVPASPGTPPLSRAAMEPMLEELGMGWAVNQAGHLKCLYQFPDFKAALGFANKVGALAEEVGHHPDLLIGWGRCGIELWTHDIGGLADCDFVLAARIEQLYRAESGA